MHKNTPESIRKGKSKLNPDNEPGPSVIKNSIDSSQVVIEPRRSFWKSFSNIFKCTTKRRHTLESDETEQANILPVHQNLQPIIEESNTNDTDSVREDIEDMKTMLKKYSISPNSISMVQRIGLDANSENISKQSSLTGYLTDVSSSSDDEEEIARKKVLLKNKINEFKQEIIREETNMQADKVAEAAVTMKKDDTAGVVNDDVSSLASTLTMDKDTYSFDYSESSQQSIADGTEEKQEKVMFDNNIIVKDENDIVTVDSIKDASQQIREQNTAEDPEGNLSKRKHEDKVAMIEEQYKIALSTVNKIEEEITAYSMHLENMNSTSDDSTPQSMELKELENKDTTQMKIFGTKIMDNQGSNLLRHLHDMHQKHGEKNTAVDESLAKTKATNKQMDMKNRCKFGYEFPYYPPGSTCDDNEDTIANREENQDNYTSSSESLNEIEVWSKYLDNVHRYRDRRDLSICRLFDNCPVNEDGYKVLRLNNLFIAVANPVTLQCSVVYDPVYSQDVIGQHRLHDNEDTLVTHKQKYMSLVEHEQQIDEEESLESFHKEMNDRNEEKWESCTHETDHEETDNDEDSDWKTVDNDENTELTEGSHEEYVNQQNQYNLMNRLATKQSNAPLEFKVTMRYPHRENFVREYVAYRSVQKVDKSTSYSSLSVAADTVDLLYTNQDAQSEISTSYAEHNERSIVFRNINDDVEHMINDLLIDVSEVKDECIQYMDEMCDEPMVEFKQTSCDGVTTYMDTSARISEAMAQTILHEILEDVFYYSEEHFSEPDMYNDQYDYHMSDNNIPDTEIHDHDKHEDTFGEDNYMYMRKDDRSKILKTLDEVMHDIMRDMPEDPLEMEGHRETMNAEMDEESCEYCPSSRAEIDAFIDEFDNKIKIIQARSILQHMFKNEANKRSINKKANTNYMYKDQNLQCNHSCTTTSDTVLNERKEILTDTNAGCNYHNFITNNFSIKSGIIGTSNILDNSMFYAGNCQNIEQHSSTSKSKLDNLVTSKCTGNECETTFRPVSSKPDNPLNKNELEQNIQENLSSFEDTMKKLMKVNRKTVEILQSTCGLFPTLPYTAENSAEKACCSNKHTESGEKTIEILSETDPNEYVTKNVTDLDKNLTKTESLTERDQNLSVTDQHLTENLEKILSKFTQQFSECVEEKSNLK